MTRVRGVPDDSENRAASSGGTSLRHPDGRSGLHDLQLGYKAPWNSSFSIGANNIFKRRGPYDYSVASSGSGAGVYSPLLDFDRYYFVQYTQKF